MVAIEYSDNPTSQRIILRPNCSMSWRANGIFFASLVLVSGIIAGGMTAMGFWLILPFAGLEMLLLGWGLYHVARNSQRQQVISFSDDKINIEKGHYYPEQRWQFLRIWCSVILERCPKQWYPSRLLIRSHGKGIEVGEFLNEDERQQLARELKRYIRP